MSVYFAESCGYMKIGYSKDPIARCSTITRNGKRPDDVPFDADVDLIGWIPGDTWRETEFHGRFTANRVAGEWFRGIDREEIRAAIWDDPCGVDMHRMTALAVFTMDRHRDVTRDELAAAGVCIEAPPVEEMWKSLDRHMARVMPGGAA